MKVTKIATQQQSENRVNIFVDGKFLTGADKLYVLQHQLSVGDELTTKSVRQLVADNARHQAYARALKLLALRPQSEAEMTQKLSRRWDGPTVLRVIEQLRREDLINDKRFATIWVEERSRLRSRSLTHLRSELAHKGVDRVIIDRTLSNPEIVASQFEIARQLAVRHLSKTGSNPRKTQAYLARRGYPYAVASRATREAEAGLANPQ